MNIETPVLAFTLNNFNKEYIGKTISEYPEGMFNLSTKIGSKLRNAIFNYVSEAYPNDSFKIEEDRERYNLIFKEKGEQNAKN